MYRLNRGEVEVFLAHPGGPLFARKDHGHWTIPKGEIGEGEEYLAAAIREFEEETGIRPTGEFIPLGWIQQKGGKIVHAWGFAGEYPEGQTHQCNTFRMEWPPGSGKFGDYPEIDRVCFFPLSEARQKLKSTQQPFLDRLVAALKNR